jgi:DNA polymerase delta subunit 1
LSGILEQGFPVAEVGRFEAECTYESNIAFALRFMIDTDIVGGNWVEVPKGKYLLCDNKSSNAQIEIDVCYEELVSHKPLGDWGKLAPLRILSFGKSKNHPFVMLGVLTL